MDELNTPTVEPTQPPAENTTTDTASVEDVFLARLDALENPTQPEEAPEAEPTEPAHEAPTGEPAPAGEGAGADTPAAPAPAEGAGEPAEVLRSVEEVYADFPAMEQNVEAAFDAMAGEAITQEMSREYAKFIQIVQLSPRELIGMELPVNGDPSNMAQIKDEVAAAEWQRVHMDMLRDAYRERLAEYTTEHSSEQNAVRNALDLFRNHPDLLPGTNGFNQPLADKVAAMASGYAYRNSDGKVIGYSAPIHGLVEYARQQLRLDQQKAEAPPPVPPEPDVEPQVGVASRQNVAASDDALADLRAGLAASIRGY